MTTANYHGYQEVNLAPYLPRSNIISVFIVAYRTYPRLLLDNICGYACCPCK